MYPKFDLQSRELSDGKSERIHESVLTDEKRDVSYPLTYYDLLRDSVELYGSLKFVGERTAESGDYDWHTYAEVWRDANFVGSALRAFGLAGGQISLVGLAGLNSPQYLTATIGIISQSMVAVPLYHNYKFDALLEIVNNCALKVLFCDNASRARQFIEADGELKTLRVIVVMRAGELLPTSDLLKVLSWDALLKIGEANNALAVPPRPDDIYVILHTSGTTGRPKGVQLSHRAVLASSLKGFHYHLSRQNFNLNTHDVYLSFLSPAHSYEQFMQILIIFSGGRIGMFGGDVTRLVENAEALRPTIVALVPRLLDKFRVKILTNVQASNPILRQIFHHALKTKLRMLSEGILRYDTIWDRFVFRGVHKKFGGRLRLITTGGAPITSATINFSRTVYGCPIMEGYGQTECAAAGTLCLFADTGSGNVGGPSPWAQIKLVDVPDMNYFAEQNRGEICFRGAGLMSGYYKDERLTAEVIDNEGWLHTGDIGEWLADNALRIIDRKRHFLKLSQGDFVAPEQIECIISQHESISQIFVTGRSTKSFLVAIVNVAENYQPKCENNHKNLDDSADTIDSIKVEKWRRIGLLRELRHFGRQCGLSPIEHIGNLHITDVQFATDIDLLTPTLKLKRPKVLAKFAVIIDALYAEGPLA